MSRILQYLFKSITIDESQSAFIKKGVSGSIVMEVIAKVLLFAITLVLTHHLSAEDYGQYSYFMGVLISFATIATFGLDDLIIKQLGNQDATIAHLLNKPALIFTLLLAGILGVVVFYSNEDRTGVGYLSGAIFLLTVQYMISSILKGKKHILSAQFPEQVVRLGVLLGLVLFQVFWIGDYSFEGIAKMILISAVVSCLISILILWKKEKITRLFPRSSIGRLLTWEVFFFAALSFFGVFRHKLDILLLGWNGMMVETGIYNISSKLSDFLLIGLMLTNALYMPLFAERKDDENNAALSKVLRSSSVLNLIIGGLLLLLFVIFGRPILSVFGEGFQEGYLALVILSIATFIYAVIGPYIVMLMMVGYARDVLIGLVLGVSIQFVLAVILMKGDAVIGMAIAKGVAIVFIQIFMMLTAWKRLGIRPFIWFTKSDIID